MGKRTKILTFILTTAAVVMLAYAYLEFNRPVKTDFSEDMVLKSVSTNEILTLFETNEELANATFVEKTIEVSGTIKDITFLNDRHTILLKSDNFTRSFVMCDMSPLKTNQVDKLAIGDTITLKGVCKGYLLDVIMLNCIPTNEKTNP